MCALSAVFDYPKFPEYQVNLSDLMKPKTRFEGWDFPACLAYVELIEKAKEFDRLNNEPNCEDPKKKEILMELYKHVGNLSGISEEPEKYLELLIRIKKLQNG